MSPNPQKICRGGFYAGPHTTCLASLGQVVQKRHAPPKTEKWPFDSKKKRSGFKKKGGLYFYSIVSANPSLHFGPFPAHVSQRNRSTSPTILSESSICVTPSLHRWQTWGVSHRHPGHLRSPTVWAFRPDPNRNWLAIMGRQSADAPPLAFLQVHLLPLFPGRLEADGPPACLGESGGDGGVGHCVGVRPDEFLLVVIPYYVHILLNLSWWSGVL